MPTFVRQILNPSKDKTTFTNIIVTDDQSKKASLCEKGSEFTYEKKYVCNLNPTLIQDTSEDKSFFVKYHIEDNALGNQIRKYDVTSQDSQQTSLDNLTKTQGVKYVVFQYNISGEPTTNIAFKIPKDMISIGSKYSLFLLDTVPVYYIYAEQPRLVVFLNEKQDVKKYTLTINHIFGSSKEHLDDRSWYGLRKDHKAQRRGKGEEIFNEQAICKPITLSDKCGTFGCFINDPGILRTLLACSTNIQKQTVSENLKEVERKDKNFQAFKVLRKRVNADYEKDATLEIDGNKMVLNSLDVSEQNTHTTFIDGVVCYKFTFENTVKIDKVDYETLYIVPQKPGSPLPEKMETTALEKLLKDIHESLQLLHNKGITHNDVKPENIVFEGERYKLIDFGLVMSDKNMKPPGGTPEYFHPCLKKANTNVEFNKKEDIDGCTGETDMPALRKINDLYNLVKTVLKFVDYNNDYSKDFWDKMYELKCKVTSVTNTKFLPVTDDLIKVNEYGEINITYQEETLNWINNSERFSVTFSLGTMIQVAHDEKNKTFLVKLPLKKQYDNLKQNVNFLTVEQNQYFIVNTVYKKVGFYNKSYDLNVVNINGKILESHVKKEKDKNVIEFTLK